MKRWKCAIALLAGVGFVWGGLSASLADDSKKLPAKTVFKTKKKTVIKKVRMKKAVVGKAAPNFTLTDTHGKKHSLGQYKGKIVVLEWLNHRCPFVKKHYNSKNMQNMQKKYAKKGVVWFSIVSSAPGLQGYYPSKIHNAMAKAKGAAPTAILEDPNGIVGKAYRARTTPHMYIINKKGVLSYAGAIDSIRSVDTDDIKKAVNYVAKALKELFAGKPVSIKKTRPYGCSVKYKS